MSIHSVYYRMRPACEDCGSEEDLEAFVVNKRRFETLCKECTSRNYWVVEYKAKESKE